MTHDRAHGVIHSTGPTGQTEKQTFLVDRPKLLSRPSPEVLEQVFRQAKALGFNPRHIEIFIGRRRKVYSGPETLVFAQ